MLKDIARERTFLMKAQWREEYWLIPSVERAKKYENESHYVRQRSFWYQMQLVGTLLGIMTAVIIVAALIDR